MLIFSSLKSKLAISSYDDGTCPICLFAHCLFFRSLEDNLICCSFVSVIICSSCISPTSPISLLYHPLWNSPPTCVCVYMYIWLSLRACHQWCIDAVCPESFSPTLQKYESTWTIHHLTDVITWFQKNTLVKLPANM